MKTHKTIFTLLILSALCSCNTLSGNSLSVESNFPLKQAARIPVNDVIQNLAVLDTWIAVGTPNKISAIDTNTQKTLWTMDFAVDPAYEVQFRVINDTLVAASTDRVILADRTGKKSEINLLLHRNELNILELTAVYQNDIYVIRTSLRNIEAYDISKNKLVWTIPDGWGGGKGVS